MANHLKIKPRKANDEYATPAEAVAIIEKHLKPQSTIWCPFDKTESQFVQYLVYAGHEVIFSHIEGGHDFLTTPIPVGGVDYIISNPPFSLKDKVFTRLYDLGIPFAMLVNIDGITDSKIRSRLFAENDIQIMFLYPRVQYTRPDDPGAILPSCMFQSGYVCHNVLPKNMMIEIWR